MVTGVNKVNIVRSKVSEEDEGVNRMNQVHRVK